MICLAFVFHDTRVSSKTGLQRTISVKPEVVHVNGTMAWSLALLLGIMCRNILHEDMPYIIVPVLRKAHLSHTCVHALVILRSKRQKVNGANASLPQVTLSLISSFCESCQVRQINCLVQILGVQRGVYLVLALGSSSLAAAVTSTLCRKKMPPRFSQLYSELHKILLLIADCY